PNPPNNAPYRLSLYAQSSYPSTYLGISKINYYPDPSKCGHGSTVAKPTTTPSITISPKKSLDCDFEQNNLCNWKSEERTFWVTSIVTLKDKNQLYYPPGDHTTGSNYGHFACISSFSDIIYEYGMLHTENPFQTESQLCFQFYYYFYSFGQSHFKLTTWN